MTLSEEVVKVVASSGLPRSEVYCEILKQLEQVGPENLNRYYGKLQRNQWNRDVLHDLLLEGRTALMFLRNGFQVQFRESPDLYLRLRGNELYAEVKHFRIKEQDELDEKTLKSYGPPLVTYGDIVPTEGVSAWKQVFRVVKKKVRVFCSEAPYLLIIGSDSPHCIDDSIIPTSINMINEAASRSLGKGFRKLNGIVLINNEYSISKRRNVYFFLTRNPLFPFTGEIVNVLHEIRYG